MRSVQPGQTILHYRLLDRLGEGGMGVVWKALDTTLSREVAIKVLPRAFAQDPERLARFEREARLLASLNHPNIATLHGLHEADLEGEPGPLRFLTMELVEGRDLATRLESGPLPVPEALKVGAQVARALEAAHARGVVHRDLKPANVVLDAADRAKVLDFGLAKALDPGAVSGSPAEAGHISLSPTVTSLGTVAGVILGTAAYMSPEQARGKPVDRRADLWSFGCLLYECLTGVRLFKGETVSDSLAAILRKDVDFSALPADTPPLVRVLLRRCLTRDPERRLQDAGDARLELEQALEDPTGSTLGLRAAAGEPRSAAGGVGRWLPWALAAAAVVTAGVMLLQTPGPPTSAAMPRHLTIPVPGATQFGDLQASPPMISPDGRLVVFGILQDSGRPSLWLRPLDSFEPRILPGTESAEYAFWSPDSRHVGFFAGGRLKRIEVATGKVQTIGGEAISSSRGGSWSGDRILYAPDANSGIFLIEASGGPSRQVTTLETDVPDCSHRWPVFLPDGNHFLYLLWTNDLESQEKFAGVYVSSLDGDTPPRRVVSDASSLAYVEPGRLLAMRGENLVAVPFDAVSLQVTGEAVVITGDVLHNRGNGYGAFSASQEGTLVYASGEAFVPSTPTWYSRSGVSSPSRLGPAPYDRIRLSPGADRAVSTIPALNGDYEIWTLDLVRGIRTRLFQAPWASDDPVWSADGRTLLYTSQESGTLDIWSRPVDGSGEATLVMADGHDNSLWDWSADGDLIAYWPQGGQSATPDIWLYSISAKKSAPFTAGEASYVLPRFSADGRWLVYASNDSGRMEVFAQAIERDGVPHAGARWQVSTAGGIPLRWREDGREIVYIDPERRIMAVGVEEKEGRLTLTAPEELFQVEDSIVTSDATGDHQRFLLSTREDRSSPPLRVILSWDAGL